MRRAALVACLCLVLVLQLPPGGADTGVSSRAVTIASWDGTRLAATLYWDTAHTAEPAPAILMTHGWAGSKEDLASEARWLAGLGYVVLAYDSRGFGASEGIVGLDGPDEQADVHHLVSWLAAVQEEGGPKVLLDDAETGDPRIGMFGYSYGGAIQLLAAATDPRIDAVAPDITWNDLERSLAPSTVVKRGWVDLLFWGGSGAANAGANGTPGQGGMDPRLQDWYLEAARTGRFPAEAASALRERSPAETLDQVTAAAFLSQGMRDTLFPPDEALANHAGLAGRDVPTHLYLHSAGHGHGFDRAGEAHYRAALERFYASTLDRSDDVSLPPVQWYDPAARTWQTAEEWPPAAVATLVVGARGGAGVVQIAQGAVPTSHTEAQELEGRLGTTRTDAPVPTHHRVVLDVDGPVVLLGSPVVRLNVTPQVEDLTLFLSLVSVSPSGSERVVGNQVTALRVEGKNGFTVPLVVPLISVAHTLPLESRLELRIGTSDSGYHGGRDVGLVELEVGGLAVDLPLFDRDLALADEDEPRSQGKTEQVPSAPLLLVLALLLGAVWVRRRSGS